MAREVIIKLKELVNKYDINFIFMLALSSEEIKKIYIFSRLLEKNNV